MQSTPIRNGERVRTHPATDAWMQGDRYGYVVEHTGNRVLVQLDSGRRQWFKREDVL